MRCIRVALTALTLMGVAGFAAHRAGWFCSGSSQADRPVSSRPCGQATDRAGREADLRYLQNQPRHWTYLLMQR
jgi:hypothetical protein